LELPKIVFGSLTRANILENLEWALAAEINIAVTLFKLLYP